jgi:hypothetical protein
MTSLTYPDRERLRKPTILKPGEDKYRKIEVSESLVNLLVQLERVIPPFLIEPIDCTADCSRPALYLVYNVISVYFKSNEN